MNHISVGPIVPGISMYLQLNINKYKNRWQTLFAKIILVKNIFLCESRVQSPESRVHTNNFIFAMLPINPKTYFNYINKLN